MAFIRARGRTKLMYFPKTASTVLTAGDLVALSSGQLIDATSSTAEHVGVLRKTTASTDADYASTTFLPVEVPVELYVEWLADVTASMTAAQLGIACDLTDAATVNTGATSHKVVRPTQFISATKGLFVINSLYAVKNGS